MRMTATEQKSVLSYYRSAEFIGRRTGAAIVTAGRCSSSTTTTCAACIEIEIPVDV